MGASGGLLRAFLGLVIFKEASEGARMPPEGPREGPRGRKKVLQEGAWRLLADLKTRFQRKCPPKRPPKGPQDGAPNGLKSKNEKSSKTLVFLMNFNVFAPPEGPNMGPKWVQHRIRI